MRTLADAGMAALRGEVMALAEALATKHGLTVRFTHHDRFAACTNAPDAVTVVEAALDRLSQPYDGAGPPMHASEHFGRFGQSARSAMFLLGAGTESPKLHNPDYDFPDTLIGQGVTIFHQILRDLLG